MYTPGGKVWAFINVGYIDTHITKLGFEPVCIHRLTEIEQREGRAHGTTNFPMVGHTQLHPQPHPQWGGEPTRPQNFTSPVNTTYYQAHEQSLPGRLQCHVG